MDVIQAIRERRSIRRFKPDPIPSAVLTQLLETARLAPSGTNRQPWRFIVVTDPVERKQMQAFAQDQAFVGEAPVVLVCCADLTTYSAVWGRQRRQEFIDYGVVETLSGRFANPAYRAQLMKEPEPPDLKAFITAATANAYIAIEHIVLAAVELGLGTCWIGAMQPREIAAYFSLPETMRVVALLPVGYPAQVPPSRPRLSLEQLLLRPLPMPTPPSSA